MKNVKIVRKSNGDVVLKVYAVSILLTTTDYAELENEVLKRVKPARVFKQK